MGRHPARLELLGLRGFFDVDDLKTISQDAIKEHVRAGIRAFLLRGSSPRQRGCCTVISVVRIVCQVVLSSSWCFLEFQSFRLFVLYFRMLKVVVHSVFISSVVSNCMFNTVNHSKHNYFYEGLKAPMVLRNLPTTQLPLA